MRACAGALVVALTLASAAPAAAIATLPKPRCIAADTVLVSKLDSRKAAPGDRFTFKVVGSIPASRELPAIPDGTLGYGVVALAQHAGAGGQPGRLVLEPRFLDLAEGWHVPATRDPKLDDGFVVGEKRDAPDAIALLPVVGPVMVGGYNAIHRGREIEIPPGTPIRVILGDDLAMGRCADPPPSDLP